MADRGFWGGLQNAFDNDEILWFIILFLLLFFSWRGGGFLGINK